MKQLLAIPCILGMCAAAPADCRVVRSRHFVQVQEVVAAVFQPLAVVQAPAYSVGAASASDPAILEKLDRIAAAIERLGPQPLALKAEPPHVALVRHNCASCHGAQPKGNKLALFAADGAFKEPTPELLGDVIARVSSGDMPRGGKMEAADRLKLIAGLTSAPTEAAAMPKAK